MFRETESKFKICDNFRIKFVPKAGVKLKHILQRNTMKAKTCNDYDGNPCVISNGKGIMTHKCTQNRVNYFAKCQTCDFQGNNRVYYG